MPNVNRCHSWLRRLKSQSKTLFSKHRLLSANVDAFAWRSNAKLPVVHEGLVVHGYSDTVDRATVREEPKP